MENDSLISTKPKHQGIKIAFAIIIIGALMVGAYFLYQYKFNNPKNIILNTLEEAKDKIKESFKSTNTDDKYKVDGYIKMNGNIPGDTQGIMDVLKNIELAFSGEVDLINSISNLNLNTKYKKNKLLDIKSYTEKNITYIFLDGIFDKYIKVNQEEEPTEEEMINLPNIDIKPDDAEILVNSMIDALKKEINKLEFKQQKETITIDGKEVNVINNYIELKDKEINDFIKNIVQDLQNDQKLNDLFKRLTGEDVKIIFNELLKGIDEETMKGTYTINFYTDRSFFKKKLVSVRETITMQGIPISFNVDRISDNEFSVSISMMGIIYSLKIKNSKSNLGITLDLMALGTSVQFELNMNYEKIKEVGKPDLSNSKDINDLTNKEKEEITKKIQDNKALNELIKQLEKNKAIESNL